MDVDLAIDVPGAVVRVQPERLRTRQLKEPIQLFTRKSGAEYGFRGDSGNTSLELENQYSVPVVVSWPRHIQTRGRSQVPVKTVYPFPSTAFGYCNLPRFANSLPSFGTNTLVTLEQLQVQAPSTSPYHNQSEKDDRATGAPFSFDTTYLLLTLSRNGSPHKFKVLLRVRIVQTGTDRKVPQSFVSWKPCMVRTWHLSLPR